MPNTVRVLLVPGLGGSGPEHWQSHWERGRVDCRRVEQADWERPARAPWVAALERAVREAPGEVVLAAHSLGCALVAHWAATAPPEARGRVRGALLVAPSDVEAPTFPAAATGFAPLPRVPLPFATVVVFSADDPYVTPARARELAGWWGSRVVDAGTAGHLDSASGVGAWPAGAVLVDALGAGR